MKKLHAALWKENKWFIARALEMEVASQGRSEKEALKNLQEAIELYFQDEDKPRFFTAKTPKIADLVVNLHA